MSYRILDGDIVLHEGLTEDEWFDKMMDLADQYYLTGFPEPNDIRTEIIED